MRQAEIEAFAAWASPETAGAVLEQADLARLCWSLRICCPIELNDLGPWACKGRIFPREAVSAAATAAVELAIVVSLWPEQTYEVLRPSWDRR